jgi:hypothetical protein
VKASSWVKVCQNVVCIGLLFHSSNSIVFKILAARHLGLENEQVMQDHPSTGDGEENQGQDFFAENQDFLEPNGYRCASSGSPDHWLPEALDSWEPRGIGRLVFHEKHLSIFICAFFIGLIIILAINLNILMPCCLDLSRPFDNFGQFTSLKPYAAAPRAEIYIYSLSVNNEHRDITCWAVYS